MHCVVVLIKFWSAIAKELDATVTGKLQTPVGENTGPLHEWVARMENRSWLRGNAKTAAFTLAGAVVGATLGVLLQVVMEG